MIPPRFYRDFHRTPKFSAGPARICTLIFMPSHAPLSPALTQCRAGPPLPARDGAFSSLPPSQSARDPRDGALSCSPAQWERVPPQPRAHLHAHLHAHARPALSGPHTVPRQPRPSPHVMARSALSRPQLSLALAKRPRPARWRAHSCSPPQKPVHSGIGRKGTPVPEASWPSVLPRAKHYGAPLGICRQRHKQGRSRQARQGKFKSAAHPSALKLYCKKTQVFMWPPGSSA